VPQIQVEALQLSTKHGAPALSKSNVFVVFDKQLEENHLMWVLSPKHQAKDFLKNGFSML